MNVIRKGAKEIVRYKAGDKVVITGFRDAPHATVTVDQPRSSEEVHLRDQYGINRRLHVSNLTPLDEWIEGEAERQERIKNAPTVVTGDNLRDHFRSAFLEYVSQHGLPKGRGRKKAVRAAYDYAVTTVPEAGPYVQAARRYAAARLAHVRQAKITTPDGQIPPFRSYTAEEATGHSLLTIGAAVVRQHIRGLDNQPPVEPMVKRPVGRPKKEQVSPTDIEKETLKKLELHVELPAEVFSDHVEAVRLWLGEQQGTTAYVVIPNNSFTEGVLGITNGMMLSILQPYLEQGARLVPTGVGTLLIWPHRLVTDARKVIEQAGDDDLRDLLNMAAAELGQRLSQKKSPG